MTTSRFPTTPMCDGDLLAAFEPTTRADDVFVATAAKCGQTWLLSLLHHLRTRGLDPTFGGQGALGVTPWLELPRDLGTGVPYNRAERLAFFEGLASPRVFKMHVIWPEIPRAEGSGAKIMTVTRDPRDVPWSMYSHLDAMKPGVAPPGANDGGFDGFFERWMENGWYFKVVQSFWPHRNDPDVLWLRYEDMKADLVAQARRCVAFLGWSVDEESLLRACGLCDFGHMQNHEGALGLSSVFRADRKFIREGAIGKNRARLSPEQQQRILERARKDFEPACFDWVVSQGA